MSITRRGLIATTLFSQAPHTATTLSEPRKRIVVTFHPDMVEIESIRYLAESLNEMGIEGVAIPAYTSLPIVTDPICFYDLDRLPDAETGKIIALIEKATKDA